MRDSIRPIGTQEKKQRRLKKFSRSLFDHHSSSVEQIDKFQVERVREKSSKENKMKSGSDSCARPSLCERLLAANEIEMERRNNDERQYVQYKQTTPMRKMKNSQKIISTISFMNKFGLLLFIVVAAVSVAALAEDPQQTQQQKLATQPTIDRQVGAAAVASSTSPSLSSQPKVAGTSGSKPAKQSASQQKKAAAIAAQQSYDRHQLKASPSYASSAQAAVAQVAPAERKPSDPEKATLTNDEREQQQKDDKLQASEHKAKAIGKAQAQLVKPPASSTFSLWKRLFPSFMSSAAAAAAVAGASAAADAHKHNMPNNHNQHSRSSASSDGSLPAAAATALLPGKLINFLTGSSKKRAGSSSGLIPDHAPVFMRQKVASDRQGGGAGALAGFASGLLSNPLGLGLLFSAPLLPSLLLTPLAIAGLSPAMSAINNFFGDDDDEKPAASGTGGPLSGPLAALMGGQAGSGSSPLASVLQQASGGSDSAQNTGSGTNSLAFRTFKSLLGPTSTTERPLFNPGMFAQSSSGIQNSFANLAGSVSSANSNQPQRASGLLGGSSSGGGNSLMQAAASMISPTFAAPPSGSGSSSSAQDDDGPGLMQMASDMFEKVASYMGSTQTGVESNKDIGQAAGSSSTPVNSPISALASLSSLSPFQLSSLFASTPLGSAVSSAAAPASSSSSGSSGSGPQKAGFFSTLRNVYELFSSSFLRRQADGSDSNECQQRLICELHQRAMNSKLFKRSLQTNLMELANLDKNLLEQIKYSSTLATPGLQARVDADTKAMLNDFLKATNNFKSGREMVNCGQMFPKCSRVQLLAAANAHLSDPANGRAIGKFSQLMKKMKFKSNQQHQSQWKLRKPNKLVPQQAPLMQQSNRQAVASQPIDYLQVAPLSPTLGGAGKTSASQLTPADSLKLVQQIMLMSQQQQQQQQQQHQQQSQQVAPAASSVGVPALAQQYNNIQQQQPVVNQQQQYSFPQYQQQQQYSQPPKQTTYTDAVVPYTSATESPYYAQAQQYTNPPAVIDASGSYYSQPQQQNNTNRQQQVTQTVGQQQQSIYYAPSAPVDQQQQLQEQQANGIRQDKSRQQQQPSASAITKP